MPDLAPATGADGSVPPRFVVEQPLLAGNDTRVASTRALKLFGQLPNPFRPTHAFDLCPCVLDQLAGVWHDPARFATVIAALLNGELRPTLHPEVAAELTMLRTYYSQQRMLASAWASARAGSAGPWSL